MISFAVFLLGQVHFLIEFSEILNVYSSNHFSVVYITDIFLPFVVFVNFLWCLKHKHLIIIYSKTPFF